MNYMFCVDLIIDKELGRGGGGGRVIRKGFIKGELGKRGR